MPRRTPRRLVPDPAVQPTITVEEAGRIIGLSRSSAYKAAQNGEIPTRRFGRLLKVPTAELRKLLGQDEGVA